MDNKKYKEYDAQDEDKLWEKFTKNNDQLIRDFFVLKYAPLVKYVAGKVSMGMPQNIDLMIWYLMGFSDFSTQ